MKLTRPKKTDAYNIDEYNKNLDEIENGINDTTKVKDIIGNLEEIEIEDIEKKTVSAYLSYIWDKLKNIELTDLKITVTTWLEGVDTPLSTVLKEISDGLASLFKEVRALKIEVTGESNLLKINNTNFATSLGEDIETIRKEVK
ncbi:hypothetical protein [Peptostreptococcus faecalis]|uniref:hypothetical protein n=1 Tax=Peptostreptococcus faecalis TaxID=2045015 RepID=UPI000C7DE966|nr:hypothetical protein [Peptostreptococcus faecalis]